MTSQDTVLEKITRSEKRVKEAADRWNAVDLAAIAQCFSALEYSASDLSEAVTALKESGVTSRSLVRSNIASLRKAALRLERLVDASAAFVRLAPGLARGDAGLYQPGGSICYSFQPPEARGTQV